MSCAGLHPPSHNRAINHICTKSGAYYSVTRTHVGLPRPDLVPALIEQGRFALDGAGDGRGWEECLLRGREGHFCMGRAKWRRIGPRRGMRLAVAAYAIS